VSPKGRHTRLNPQSPLVAPEPDLEKILKKGKVFQGDSSSTSSDTSGNLPGSSFHTLVDVPLFPHFSIAKTPIKSKQGDFPIEYSSFSPELKEESLEKFDVLASPEVVNRFRLESLEYFPLLGSPSPHLFKFFVTKEQ